MSCQRRRRLGAVARQLQLAGEPASASAVAPAPAHTHSRDYTAFDADELAPAGLLQVHSLNHVSKQSDDVPRLVAFYQRFLGFVPLARPGFPFGGAWPS
jgi:hypothetical protein